MAKITVNGVSYDSVEAMPAEARRVYDEALANVPELADRDGDGIPDIVRDEGISVRHGTTVRKKFVVNGTTYDDVNAMPPDVRQAYDHAMRALGEGGPKVTKNEIKMSFQLTGPGFSFHTGGGAPSRSRPASSPAGAASVPRRDTATPTPAPIEPSSLGGGGRMALILLACAAGALMLWLLARAR